VPFALTVYLIEEFPCPSLVIFSDVAEALKIESPFLGEAMRRESVWVDG
jgi:hypothetical protein